LIDGHSPVFRGAAFRFLLQSLQPAGQAHLRRGIHPIDKENSVKMIDLVLNRARQQTGRLDFDLLVF
jgi:hypothetical protein